jgi:hypothetical protein
VTAEMLVLLVKFRVCLSMSMLRKIRESSALNGSIRLSFENLPDFDGQLSVLTET